MTELFLIRHGKTTLPDHFVGHLDVPLSAEGRAQLKRLARALARGFSLGDRPFAAIYSSDLTRSVESARILAGSSNLAPLTTPELREMDFGLWEGLTFEEINERYPKELSSWREEFVRRAPPGGETMLSLRKRVLVAFERILRRHPDGERIAIVGHGGVNRAILCHLLGIPLKKIFLLGQEHGGMDLIEMHGDRAIVKLLNWQPF